MISTIFHSFSSARNLTVWLLAFGLIADSAVLVHARRYLPGTYSGVVVFDRWDSCRLLVNHFELNISDTQKELLRKHAGKCIKIHADDIDEFSSNSPLVNSFKYLGPVPKINRRGIQTDLSRLELSTHMDFSDDGQTCFIISATNQSPQPNTLFSFGFGFKIIRENGNAEQTKEASDGKSLVIIGGQTFEILERVPRLKGEGMTKGLAYRWNTDEAFALPHSFILGPNETRIIKLEFELPDGRYDFLSCYGGNSFTEQCVISNQTFFDVNGGNFESDEISGAFGYRLGAPFNIPDAVLEVKHKNGLHEYRIKPAVGLNSFDTYSIRITPKTKKIFNITATARRETSDSVSQVHKGLSDLLERKYGFLELILSSEPYPEVPVGRSDGTRDVCLVLDSSRQTVRMVFEDRLLHVQAKKEALELKLVESVEAD